MEFKLRRSGISMSLLRSLKLQPPTASYNDAAPTALNERNA